MAALMIVKDNRESIGSIFLGDGAKGIPIKMAYLGDILVYNGQRWL